MGDLYFIEHPNKIVYIYSPTSDGAWQLSRLSPSQKNKVIYVLLWLARDDTGGWVLQDQSPGAKGAIIGFPGPGVKEEPSYPPLGPWHVGGFCFTLADRSPVCPPLDVPFSIQVPFATLDYKEDGNIARVEIKMHKCGIADEVLEDLLGKFEGLLLNLARRPHMVMMIFADAEEAAVPSFRHVKRFLNFVQENGPELFLVGRATAIVLRPRGILGATLISIIKMVQRLLPSPWPEAIVPTKQEADDFLAQHAAPFQTPLGDAQQPPQSLAARAEPMGKAILRPAFQFMDDEIESPASRSTAHSDRVVCTALERTQLETESASIAGISALRQDTSVHTIVMEDQPLTRAESHILFDNAAIGNTNWSCWSCASQDEGKGAWASGVNRP